MAQELGPTGNRHYSVRSNCSRNGRLHRLRRRQGSTQRISDRASTEKSVAGLRVASLKRSHLTFQRFNGSSFTMTTEFERAEQAVVAHSASLKKPLALGDLVLTQILFVVGSSWVGAAAKLGQAHLVFWLLAIVFFYIPQAAVVIYLNRLMPLEGGLYQWAKLGFNEFVGFIVAWNLWLLSISVIALGGMFVTTNLSYALGQSWMPNSKWCVSLISCALVLGLGWSGVRGLSLGKWVHNIGAFAMLLVYGALILLPFFAVARGELNQYHPLQFAAPAVSIFYCLNIFSKLAVGALSGFEYVAILAGETRA